MIVIMATLHKKEIAHSLGKGLLKERLIACYNLASIESAYWWKGEIIEEPENLLLMKTTIDKFADIETYFMKHSGYEVPELVALKPDKVNASYRRWVEDETKN